MTGQHKSSDRWYYKEISIRTKVEVSSPYYSGKIEALCVEKPVYDLIIGNIKGARPPQDPGASWSPPQESTGVETRAIKTISKRMPPIRPLKVPSVIDVDKTEFVEAQKTDGFHYSLIGESEVEPCQWQVRILRKK